MNDLNIGDRVRVISDPKFIELDRYKSIVGMTGTVKDLEETCAGVEFDEDIGGHCEDCDGKDEYCWYLLYERLEKIGDTEEETAVDTEKETKEEAKEEVKEETKAETMEQKILKALREEIGVEVGEEFYVYENGRKQWTCKFEENGFYRITDESSYESGIWKNIIGKFHKYQFKRKPFIPQNGEKYWHFGIRDSLKGNRHLDVFENVWDSLLFDYGMLALGNVFRSKEEALKGEDKLLERLNELLKEE